MTVPVPLTDIERYAEHESMLAVCEALRIAVDTLKVVAADGPEYWQCTAALVRIAALDPRPTTEAGDDGE